MTRLQAALKDKSAATWRERKVMYKIGSVFKGCANCGVVEEEELSSGRVVRRYLSGLQVFRSYDPSWLGWTWACWECGAKDLACWAPDQLGMVEAELGKSPVRGSREGMAAHKYALRKELTKLNPRAVVPRAPSQTSEIARLEGEVEKLMAMLKVKA